MGIIRESHFLENPFRIVGSASSISYGELRKRADALARNAIVGLHESSPLDDLFGPGDSELLPSKVRALEANFSKLTTYRLFWPATQERMQAFCNDSSDGKEDEQLVFLKAYVQFLKEPSNLNLENALSGLANFKASTAFRDDLAQQLITDRVSKDQIQLAFDGLIRAVIEKASATIIEVFESGDPQVAAAFIQKLFRHEFDQTLVLDSLEPLVRYGEELRRSIESIASELPAFTPGHKYTVPPQVEVLLQLADALQGHHPAAGSWLATSYEWSNSVVARLEDFAVSEFESGREEAALKYYQEATTYASDPETKKRLKESISIISRRITDIQKNGRLLPINAAPSMWRLNGIGTTLIQMGRNPEDPSKSFGIFCFTFVFIPIFPIARYLVSDSGNGQFTFYGRTKWTLGMKIYLAASMAVCILGFIALQNSANKSTSSSYETPSYQSSYSAPSYAEPQPQTPQTPEERKQEEERLGKIEKWSNERDRLINLSDPTGQLLDKELASLKEAQAKLDKEFKAISKRKPDLYSSSSVRSYNRKVDAYEDERKSVNKRVDSYNQKLKAYKDKLNQIDALQKQIDMLKR